MIITGNITRQFTRPPTACRCHPIGSMGSSCDQESGQCRCRVGVVGSFCNRCAPGYHQSRSTLEPCVRELEGGCLMDSMLFLYFKSTPYT